MSNRSWIDLGLNDALSEALLAGGLMEPTEVQRAAIPLLLEGRDLSARSQTGTGKTLAFLLPLLQRIEPRSSAVQAVILSPTQELAMQIVRVAEQYAAPLGIGVQQLIGGASLQRQLQKLKLRPQLLIGTPGRMHELLKLRKLKLDQVRSVVIDEADQIFALGSTADVETLLFATGKERQMAFFSATHPEQMARFEGRWMNEPHRLQLSPEHRLPPAVDNCYIVTDQRDKADLARRLIRLLNPRSALLFLNDTDQIANWQSKLSFEGFAVEALYGDSDKQRRAATLARFRDGRCQLLLATDVAARGLDIEGLPLVLQLDPAADADHYVHRSGRTGRMGRSGTVITIVTPQQKFIMDKFSKQLGIQLEERELHRGKLLPVKGLNVTRERGEHRRGAPSESSEGRSARGAYGLDKAIVANTGRFATRASVAGQAGGAEGGTPGEASSSSALRRSKSDVSRTPIKEKENALEIRGGGASAAGSKGRAAGPKGRPAGQNGKAASSNGKAMTSNGKGGAAKPKAKRPGEGKNKGAPKWLKQKWSGNDKQ